MRKDKKQIIGEEISDESIKLFLGVEPADDTPSLHKLIKAYRGLRIDDFERFLTFFREAGYDLDARRQGQRLRRPGRRPAPSRALHRSAAGGQGRLSRPCSEKPALRRVFRCAVR